MHIANLVLVQINAPDYVVDSLAFCGTVFLTYLITLAVADH